MCDVGVGRWRVVVRIWMDCTYGWRAGLCDCEDCRKWFRDESRESREQRAARERVVCVGVWVHWQSRASSSKAPPDLHDVVFVLKRLFGLFHVPDPFRFLGPDCDGSWGK